ncbi:chromosome partition protein Smc [Spirochaetia bacterium]|nr:chromosome partition protein Smc [Spirochaetia bacterium]GHU31687.1 chromosome partition protein Smc [Spirochaetia bacterium]
MFLKSLDITGFKSFADRTHLEFADGITALLGPNGCGKSNVVDAIKWVLGEQASHAMRAEKMEDVIFNGTENRNALNSAEVTLTISNESGILKLDTPELQIKRKITRSGESEYFINTARTKLKDVRELFWDTGIGKAAYSVMEQGKIDQILSSKPDERRYLFEEAAGITKFKAQSAEADRKIIKTEENMRQVEGILGEARRVYDSLKTQSEKTLKYRDFQESIFNAELDIHLLKLKQYRHEYHSQEELLKTRTAERDSLRQELDKLKAELEAKRSLVGTLEAQFVENQKNVYGLAIEKNAREKERKLLLDQQSASNAKITQNQSRERAASSRIEDLTADADEQDAVVRDFRAKVLSLEDRLEDSEEKIRHFQWQITENDLGIRRAEDESRNLDQERMNAEKERENLVDAIVAALDTGLADAGYSAVERQNAEQAVRESLNTLKQELGSRGKFLRDIVAAAERVHSGAPVTEVAGFVEKLSVALSKSVNHCAQTLELFEQYRRSAPAFLDDFLAPGGIITTKRSLDDTIRSCVEGIAACRNRAVELRTDSERVNSTLGEYRLAAEELRMNRIKLDTQANAAEEHARLIRRELSGQESLLRTILDELFLDRKYCDEVGERIGDLDQELADIEQRGVQLSAALEGLEQEIQKQAGGMTNAQDRIQKGQDSFDAAAASLEKIHLACMQAGVEIKNIQDNFRETHGRDLNEFEDRLGQIKETSGEIRETLTRSRSGLKNLGAVNLMAPEEFAEAKDRYDFLAKQLDDLKQAKKDLERISAEIRTESAKIFLSSYNKIRKNFQTMFKRLFGGGKAELRLTEPGQVLESGIEIYAQPPGKKLENIALLSGGERSMTAVALLFATYQVKPSPFCLLDEIDAALDEANVHRFVQLLMEFGSMSQFIVITHNKKTVIGAGTLIGVTMEESGITKVVSVRLEEKAT